MKTFILTITQEDIDKATQRRREGSYSVCVHCVAAVALRRIFNTPFMVGHDNATVCAGCWPVQGKYVAFRFGCDLENFIKQFDAFEHVEPASFTITARE